MHKRHILKGLMACLVMLMFACQKDNQGVDYKEINNLTIDSPLNNLTVSVHDSLIIAPKLIQSLPASGDEFSYSWKYKDKEVSNKSSLRMIADLEVADHVFFFTATNKKTGAQTLNRYVVTVRGTYYSGIYVAHNQQGKGEFSFLRGDDVLFSNPFEDINEVAYSGSAVKIEYLPPATFGDGEMIVAVTDQGMWRFGADDLMQITDLSTMIPGFSDFPITSNFAIKNSQQAIEQLLVMKGAVYSGDLTGEFSDRLSGDYLAYPGVFTLQNIQPTYYYDNKNKRFITSNIFASSVNIAAATIGAGAVFNMANVGLTMISHAATGNNNDSEFYYLMTDGVNRFLLSNFNSNFAAQGTTTVGIKQQISTPDINNLSSFVVSAQFKQMYYAAGNKIYLYDIVANSARLLYTFPNGYVIKKLEKYGTNRIVAATNSGAGGEIYYFDLAGDGTFTGGTFVKKFGGFGTIESIAIR